MPSETIAALLEQVPGPDNQSLTSPADVEKLERVADQLLAGGADSITDLIAQLRQPAASDLADVKARYVLHVLAVKVAGDRDAGHRRALAATLAGSLAGDAPVSVKKYLARELQVCGNVEAVAALGALLTHDDHELADTAAQALTAIRAGAAEQFRVALPRVQGANRLIVLQNLGVLQDQESVAALKESLADEDQQLRLTAGWALANIGEPSAAEALTNAADREQGYARTQADKASLLLAEKLLAAGNKTASRKIYTHLRDARQEPSEKYIRDAAERGLKSLGG